MTYQEYLDEWQHQHNNAFSVTVKCSKGFQRVSKLPIEEYYKLKNELNVIDSKIKSLQNRDDYVYGSHIDQAVDALMDEALTLEIWLLV